LLLPVAGAVEVSEAAAVLAVFSLLLLVLS
jgi:hypothetical protein